LLIREVLDADQVTRLVNGVPLEPLVKTPAAATTTRETGKDRGATSLVPPINPKPLHESS
jgi:hypothetical protein